ncbi:fibronectin type III domain-containing protein [Streptomyces sp. A7024]|uniref:Fibronectin type III domain-containing protein n=1 Tax=Streptomyces coryli TaxID=1128680 RepID=A0A6G4TTP0_9ACTN|nr:DNRLRE domain-containing protein [Streptomyces coryli]NGN63234.1 fibronectin type III domain-containing protein [Streptomyces coryli]
MFRRKRPAALAAAFAMTAAALTGLAGSGAATALTPPVAMTADDLPTWQTNGVVWTLAESNGTVFAGGTFSAVRPPGSPAGSNEQQALNFVALDAATGEPTGCKLNFTIGSGTATVRALAVSPDGSTLYAGGDFGAVNGVSRSRVAAIDIASCSVKTGFNAGSVSARVHGLSVASGRLYLAGDFNTVAGQTRNKFAAVDASTGALSSWSANAGTDRAGRAIEETPDGQHVVLGGDFSELNGAPAQSLAVVRADNGDTVKAYKPVDNNWNRPGEMRRTSTVKDLHVDSTGIYTGNEGTGGGVFDGRLAMNLGDFSERWRDTCLGATQAVIAYKEVLYSSSHAHNCASEGQFSELNERQHLLGESINTDRPLLSWFPDTDDGPSGTEQIGPRAMAVSSKDGKDFMWVGGEFTRIASNGNKLQQGLVRFANTPDTRAPAAAPDEVTAANVTGGVQLKWRTGWDRDDSRLTYTIYRNGTALADKPTLDSKFWTRPQGSFTDGSTQPGTTYTYQIAASDPEGNTARSETVSVTTPGTPTETTIERTATADAYVNGAATGDNYGTHQQLFVRGSSPYLSYLRFSLPQAPSGMVLKSAKLTVRTTSDATAGTPDDISVQPVTGSWEEAAVTYANRPALGSGTLGTVAGPTELNTDYAADLSTSSLSGALGGDYDVALTSAGSDAVRFWSRETSNDPKLTLTFGTP